MKDSTFDSTFVIHCKASKTIHGKSKKKKTVCGFKNRVMTTKKDLVTCGSCIRILWKKKL